MLKDELLHEGISDGFTLLCFLKRHFHLGDANSWWWPSFLSKEVRNGVEIEGSTHEVSGLYFVIASILGQNTKYENSFHAIKSLYEFLYVRLEGDLDSKRDFSPLTWNDKCENIMWNLDSSATPQNDNNDVIFKFAKTSLDSKRESTIKDSNSTPPDPLPQGEGETFPTSKWESKNKLRHVERKRNISSVMLSECETSIKCKTFLKKDSQTIQNLDSKKDSSAEPQNDGNVVIQDDNKRHVERKRNILKLDSEKNMESNKSQNLDSQKISLDEVKNLAYPKLALISTTRFQNKILEILSNENLHLISEIIRKAGFYNQKALRIQMICRNILKDFGNFETFYDEVSKEWLLSQKGIGNESASSILNYALRREEMVVDSYTHRLLCYIGYEFENYEDMQTFLCNNLERAADLYDFEIPLSQIMARLHGKIVEFSKIAKLKRL